MKGHMELTLTRTQHKFMQATAVEVLFGGAAGGGKSFAQMADALVYALRYPGSRQLILRRTLPELERSLVRTALERYPKELYSYHAASHTGRFANGSILEFAYCDGERDVYRYQSAEYDVIRFDELTHFTEGMYTYLLSRLRGTRPIPRQIKSSSNPGGIGHAWVKARFVDPAPPGQVFETEWGSRVYLPSRVTDNPFLMEADPDYQSRLQALGGNLTRALLEGDWNISEGQYFPEFSRRIHVCDPADIPPWHRRYVALDYGLDMLAALLITVDGEGRAWVHREVYKSGLIISEAAREVLELLGEGGLVLAPPDLWNRRQETGRSAAEIFLENGVELIPSGGSRVGGWLAVKEYLLPRQGGPLLHISRDCVHLIRTLSAIRRDKNNPNDAAREPHELTHAPDALRYFCTYRAERGQPPRPRETSLMDSFRLSETEKGDRIWVI